MSSSPRSSVPLPSTGSTGRENDCNSPQDPAAATHSHGRVWQWRKQDRVLQILNGQQVKVMISAQSAARRPGQARTAASLSARVALDTPRPWPPPRTPNKWHRPYLTTSLSSAAHTRLTINVCPAAVLLFCPIRGPDQPRSGPDGGRALRVCVGGQTGPSFPAPLPF